MDKINKLKALLELSQNDTITPKEVEKFLTLLIGVVKKTKEDFTQLSSENLKTIKDSIAYIEQYHKENLSLFREEKNTLVKEFLSTTKELKDLIAKVKTIKPIDGKDGKDGKNPDPKEVADLVLKALPETKEITGEDIANKLEMLDGEDKLDFSALKNVPKFNGGNSGGVVARNIYQMGDVVLTSLANNDTLKWNSTNNRWENGVGGGAGTIDGSGTANELSYWVDADTLGTLAVATYPSLTELSYVKGLTSSAQTQITAKAPSTSPTFATSITGSYLTASEMLITDGSKNIVSAAVATYPSLTELTYLKGVTSEIQTQLNAKQVSDTQLTDLAGLSYAGNALKYIRVNAGENGVELATVAGGTIDGSGTTNELTYWVDSDTLGALAVATYPSLTELSYVKGVTSAIQTQLNSKQASGTYVTSITVASSNGFAGSSSGGATPALTLTTSITGVLKGNGTAISAATAGSDYAVGSIGLSGGQTIAGSTLTAQNLTLRANAADLTTGAVIVSSTKEATNTTTGSVQLAGGLAVAKRVYALDMTVTNTITGSVSGNAATVTTNANLTGHITSTGNAAVLGSFTKAQLNTAVSNGDVVFLDSADTITGVKTFATSTIKQNNPAGTFAYTIVPSAIAAARNLTIPLITADDTLAVLGLAQTYTAASTYTAAAPQITLGANTTTLGALKMFGNTSGNLTIQPSAVAGTNLVATFPAVTGTVVVGATSTTTTQAMFATSTAGAPAFRAIAAGDLPGTLTSGTAITNAALTTPTLGTPASGTLTSCTGYKISSLAAPTAALALTFPATNEMTYTFSATTQTGLLETSSTLTTGTIEKLSVTGSSAVASSASSGSLLTLTSSTTGFTGATQRMGAIYSTGANSNASVVLQGLDISVANTGTTNTNQALRLSASGGSTTNIALDIAAGELRLGGSAGTAGKLVVSAGANATPVYSTPTFPTSASATSRKKIVSDGTNWVASTETWAVPGTSGNVLTSDGTNWTSAAPSSTVYYQQKIPIALSTISEGVGCGSNTDGSVIYVMTRNITELRRFARNTAGTYTETHSANVTTAVPNGNWGGVIVIGSYVYVFFSNSTNIISKRYSATDLTGEQAMTVPTVSCTANCAAWTDGTDAYVVSNNSDTTSRKWTLSGTTFSASTTGTITTGIFTSATAASFWNGTNAFIAKKNTSTPNVYTLYKLTSIDGSATTSSTFNMYKVSDDDIGIIFAPISSTLAYVGTMATTYNATAAITTNISLFPVALP